MIEEHTTYSYIINKLENPSFRDVYNIALNNAKITLRKWEPDIFRSISRGVAIINNEPQMLVYMHSYGRMHEAKLKLAFDNVNELIWNHTDICVIDYGCGQGIASMVLLDYLKVNNINIGNIKHIKLIEPSAICLKRAALHISMFAPNTHISTINKKLDMLSKEDIKTTNSLTVHLFSNILDIETVSLIDLANNINSSSSLLNEIICVGPLFADLHRNNRMDTFCKYIDLNTVFNIEYDKSEWINNWSVQIRICSNIPVEKFKQASPIKNYVTEPNKININSWPLLTFAKIKGKMQIGTFVSRQTGKEFKSCVFTDESNPDSQTNKTFVAFSSKLGELTSNQISKMKHELKVVYEDDVYYLCKFDEQINRF